MDFGPVIKNKVYLRNHDRECGYLEMEKANVKWFLSIDGNLLKKNENSRRSLKVNNNLIDFNNNFTNLHNTIYELILTNNYNHNLKDNISVTKIISDIRNIKLSNKDKNTHHLYNAKIKEHPFNKDIG